MSFVRLFCCCNLAQRIKTPSMIFNVISEAVSSPWCISPEVMAQARPLFKQVLAGASLGVGVEPAANLQYQVSVKGQLTATLNAEGHDGEEEQTEIDSPEFSPVINVVPIRGMMFKNDQECGPRGTRTLGKRLMDADKDPMVIGHIIIFETPGGTMDAINELEPVMGQLTKPVIGWIDDLMCSAGLWIGSYCQELIAGKERAIIGSVGVMTSYEGRKSKSEANADGVVEVTIYADGSLDKNAAYETAINNFDFKLAKEQLNKYYERFAAVIRTNRPNCTDDQLHGKTFESMELVGTLIDAIGPFDMAVERVIALSNFKPAVQQQTAEASSINNSNKVTMRQFTGINGVLGVEQLEGDEQGVYMNETQLEAIEATINTNASELATAQTNLQTATAAQTAAETAQQTAEATVAATLAALDAIGPTVAAATDATAKVAAVKTLLAAKIAVAPVGTLKQDSTQTQTEPGDGWDEATTKMANNL